MTQTELYRHRYRHLAILRGIVAQRYTITSAILVLSRWHHDTYRGIAGIAQHAYYKAQVA